MSGGVRDHSKMVRLGHTGLGRGVDFTRVTALAYPAGAAGRPFAVAPAKRETPSRLPGSSTWRQPEPWTVAFVLLTGVVVGFRHPIARAIGTEVDVNAAAPSVVATAAPQPVATATQRAVAAALAAVPTHAPRDPFRSLVGAGAAVLAPEAEAAASGTAAAVPHRTHVTQPTSHEPTTTGVAAAGSSSCAGTMHTVVSGDTLWSLAARTVKSGDTTKVTVAWHRIYRANRPPLSNPSLLPVGTKICLPG